MTDYRKAKLSVIIVTYNNKTELDECLDSIFAMNDIGERLEVIIADNSPNDFICHRLREYPMVKYIRNPLNGFGRGNNVGYSISTGDLLVFMNPDTKLISPIFERVIKKYYTTPDCGMAGIQLLDKNGKEHNSYNIRLNYGLAKKGLLKLSRLLKWFPQGILYTSGADIIMDRKLFESIGKFDEHIFMYGEEQDLANRVNQQGRKVCYFRDLRMMHLQGMSTTDSLVKIQERMNESNRHYCRKFQKDFKKEITKEIRAMRLINAAYSVFGIRKYSSELVQSYIDFRDREKGLLEG